MTHRFNSIKSTIKIFLTIMLISTFSSSYLISSTLIIINNTQLTLFVSDGIQMGVLLTPSQQYIIQSAALITLFFYEIQRIQTPQTFKVICRLKELTTHAQPTTLNYTDIISKSLHIEYPREFEITPHALLRFEQQHTAKQSAITSKPNQSKINNSTQQHTNHYKPYEPKQAAIEALISQLSSLRQKQKTIDTTHLKPMHKSSNLPKIRRKK